MPLALTSGGSTVLVDMDGVMAEFEEANNDIIRTHFPEIIPVARRAEFYFADTYKAHEGVGEKVYKENRRPGFFKNFPVVDGAVEGWRRILEAGYQPRVCSSPLQDHDTVVDEKIDWLMEHFVPVFGDWVVKTAIFNRDKSGYDAFAVIDDRPTLRNIGKAAWQHIVFSRSYNQSVETEFRLEGWYDPALKAYLVKLEKNINF